jgi:hypothetical protein
MIHRRQCHVAAMAVPDNVNFPGSFFSLNGARQIGACIHSRLMDVESTPLKLANLAILPKCSAQRAAEKTPAAPPGIIPVGETTPP